MADSDGAAAKPAEQVEAGFALVGPGTAPWSVSRLQVALKDSANALPAELPTALML
ncbi:hypothetical protein ACWCQQ_22075 [Streptomyces sp. NPDC002143]